MDSDERAKDYSERQSETGEEIVMKIVKNPFHMNEVNLRKDIC